MPAEAVKDQMIFRLSIFLNPSGDEFLPINDSISIPKKTWVAILVMRMSMFSQPKVSRVCSGKKNRGNAREIPIMKWMMNRIERASGTSFPQLFSLSIDIIKVGSANTASPELFSRKN